MDFLFLFGLAFLTALSGVLAPGPVLFATVRWSAEHGRLTGPAIVAGHVAVEVPLVIGLVVGLGQVLMRTTFIGVVGLAGGVVLLGMGLFTLAGVPDLELPGPPGATPHSSRRALARIAVAGALTSLANPYFPLWWGTVGLTFISRARALGVLGYVVFYLGHALADLAWYAIVSESIHRGRWLLSNRAYRGLVGACAVLLAVFGVLFAWQGGRRLAGL